MSFHPDDNGMETSYHHSLMRISVSYERNGETVESLIGIPIAARIFVKRCRNEIRDFCHSETDRCTGFLTMIAAVFVSHYFDELKYSDSPKFGSFHLS